MDKKVKTVLIVIALVVLAMFFSVFSSMSLTSAFQVENVKEDRANLKDMIITETKDGGKYWEIYAQNGYYDGSENDITLEKLIGNFYENGKVMMSFESQRGNYKTKSKTVTLIDNAKVVYLDGSFISASSIQWSGKEETITAIGYVEMYKDGIVSNSDKSIFDTGFTKFKLFGNASTSVYNKN